MTSTDGRKNRIALITGASTGIGYELAKILAREGHSLAINARSVERLEEVAAEIRESYGVEVRTYPMDLSTHGSGAELVERLASDGLEVEVLVNNAGFGSFGHFDEVDEDVTLRMIQLNMTTLTQLTRLLLPGMIERGYGRVLNVASTAAFQPGPLMAIYFATKAYVLSFSEAVGEEVRRRGVTVTALCPGMTDTNFFSRAEMGSSGRTNTKWFMGAQPVAEAGYRGMMKGKSFVIPGWLNAFGARAVRLTPRRLVPWLMYRFQKKAGRRSGN